MKHTRLVTLTIVSFCLVVLASFKLPSAKETYMDKNIVFKVSYDASMNKVVATEKLEVSSSMILRSDEGKILNVDKNGILSQMPMAMKMPTNSMTAGNSNVQDIYALVAYHAADKGANIPTDEKMLEYLKVSYDSFTKHNFAGSDYSVSGKNWSCAGPSCGYNVPTGIDVYVWEQ